MAQGRAKRPHQKVKTGCMTCRKRRIKCDEGKPTCRQCNDSSRKCEGYQPPQTWLFMPRKVGESKDDSDDSTSTSASTLVQFVSPLSPIGDSNDKRSFQFWNEQAAPIFSYYFGHSFWTELLPQIGLAQPAVKHLLLATSSLVESTAFVRDPYIENAVYQTHYTKALQATRASPQIESVLLACLLFACCEFMKGSSQSGLRHIKAGLSIIDEWVKSTKEAEMQLSLSSKLIIQTIAPIFLAYIDKAPTYGMGSVDVNENACTTIIQGIAELPCIEQFDEIHRAMHALDGIAHHIARLMDSRRPAWTPSQPEEVQNLLDSWRKHFDIFEANLPPSRKQSYALSLKLIRVHYNMCSIMLRVSRSKHENVYEAFDKEFSWIVTRYNEFAQAWAKDPTSKFFKKDRNVEYHMGYIPPLYLTATKCRNPAIRLAALRHLGSLRVSEGNWTSCTAYLIARTIIEIEDTGAIKNQRIGMRDEHDLIRPVEVSFSDKHNRQAGLDYLMFPYGSSPMLRETIELPLCPAAGNAQWPLSRIVRIGGYQGGITTPAPTLCYCGFSSLSEALPWTPD